MGGLKRKLSVTAQDEPRKRRPKLATRWLDEDFISGIESLNGEHDIVGNGNTADVRFMYRKTDPKGKVYAVKEFFPSGLDQKSAEQQAYHRAIYSEFYIAQRLNHPNIVSSYETRKVPGSLAIVMEYCGAGDLLELSWTGGNPEMTDRKCHFKQMVRGVAHMHAEGVAHRGIQPDKLLVTKYGGLKLCDFGSATVFHEKHGPISTTGEANATKLSLPNTIPTSYTSPEVYARNQKYDSRAADVWSLGVTALMLYMCRSPWDEPNTKTDCRFATFMRGWDMFLDSEGYRPITDTVFPDCGLFFEHIEEPALRTLLLRMLHPMPERRITFHEVLNHPWVQQIECCSPAAKGMRPPQLSKRHDHVSDRVKRLVQKWWADLAKEKGATSEDKRG